MAPELPRDWIVEVYLRFLGQEPQEAGIEVRAGDSDLSVTLRADHGEFVISDAHHDVAHGDLPVLGDDQFDPARYHAIEVRARTGRAEVRLDGVVVATGLAVPHPPTRLGLYAFGAVVFDAISIVILAGDRTG